MDPNRFDVLIRSLRQPRSRRGVVATLLAGVLGPVVPAAAEARRGRAKRRGGKGKSKGKDRQNVRPEQIPANCCSTGACTPGKGKNLSKCCYEDGNVSGKNFSGANLGSPTSAAPTPPGPISRGPTRARPASSTRI